MLSLDSRRPVAVVRLAHGKAHALDLELLEELDRVFAELAGDDEVRAAVLTGTGKIFSAGVDLFRLTREGEEYVDAFVPRLSRVFRALFAFPKPLVGAINGHAIAGGCIMACVCDYRSMARGGGTLGVPELKVGVPFPLVAIEILRFATSAAHLQELVYRGKTYTVEEAWDRGLVDEIVEPDRLLDRALEVATGLASEPSARFRITKRQLRRPTLERMERFAVETDAEVLATWKSESTRTAIREYMETVRGT
jgi:enoyl-CoA hydratase